MHPYLESNIEKIESTGCWLWRGPKYHNSGAPKCIFQGEEFSARRMVWEASGKTLGKKSLTPECGQLICVNPEHLTYGRREFTQEYIHVQKNTRIKHIR